MGLGVQIARRSLFGRPGRTLFSILGVAVGIATVVAVFTLDHVTVLSRTARLDPGWGADFEVRPRAEKTDARAELLQLEGVAGVAAFFQNDVKLRPAEAGEEDVERVQLVALEAGSGPSLGVYHVEEGDDLAPGNAADGVLLGRKLAEDHDLSPGDLVFLAPPERAARKACVDGVLTEVDRAGAATAERAFRVLGVLGHEGIGRKSGGRMVLVDYGAGRELLSGVFVESQFWVKRDPTSDLEAVEADLSRGFTFERNATRAVGQMADERAFRNGVRLAGLFALLLGLYVIFHTLSMSLVERVREVGNLHALGATRAQIARVFFLEALVIALAAGALGILLGIALAAGLLRVGITTLGVTRPVPLIEVPWESVLGLSAVGVAIALLGSVYPMLRARDTDIVAALRGEETGKKSHGAHGFHLFATLLLVLVVPAAFFSVVPIVGAAEGTLVATITLGLAVLALLIGLPFVWPGLVARATSRLARPFRGRWPLAGQLTMRNLEESPTRIGASIAAIALVTAAFCGLKGMTRSLAAEVEVWGDEAMVDKVWIEGLPDLPFAELRAALADQPEVLGIESGDARAYVSFLLIGLDPDAMAGYGPLAEDPTLVRGLTEEKGILISRRLARQRGLAPGDAVLMNTSGHAVQEFRVLAVTDAYGYFRHPDERAYGIVDARHLERFFCVDSETTSSLAVRLAEGADPGVVAAALHARFPAARGLRGFTGAEVQRLLLADLKRDFVLFDVILFLTALLAGLGVLNGQLLAALERKKELGLLRALGTTRGQIAGAVLLESSVIGLTGGLLGLLVGTGLTPVLVSALRVLSGLPLPVRTAGPVLLGGLLGAIVVALLAGLYPIWRMNRLDAVRAVRTG